MDSIIEKIQKCLELARRGGTEGEATAAMSMVQALLAKHNLSLAEVESKGQKAEDYIRNEAGRLAPWQRYVWNGISKLYFCSFFASGSNGIVIGKPSNIAIVSSMAAYVCSLGEQLAKAGSKDRTFRNSFKAGFAQRISQRCFEEIKRAKENKVMDENTCTALVLAPLYEKTGKEISLWMARQGIQTSRGRSNQRVSNRDGYFAGRSAGDGVSLGRNGITGGGSTTLKLG